MTETSEALGKQTEELTVKKFGDQEVVLGPGFTESNPETVERVQRYKFEKYFPDVNFDDVKNYINDFYQKPKKFIKRQVDEYKFQRQEPEFIETIPEPKMIPTPEFAEGKEKPKTKYTQKEIYDMLLEGGFKEDDAKIMAAVAMAESGGDSEALNDDGKKDLSYGLFQINMIGGIGPERRDLYNLDSNNNLYDPMTNIRVAKEIFDKQGYGAWGAYTNNSYKTFLNSSQ